MKIVGIVIASYVGLVATFESLLGVFQPGNESTVVITTTSEDGTTHDRVLARVESDGKLYASVNHWPRAWYYRALERPEVRVDVGGETGEYTAVPVEGAEYDRVVQEHAHPLAFRLLTGFPPRRLLRLDPR